MQKILHICMTSFPPKQLAELLRAKMAESGITQEKLGEATGVHQSQICRILQGRFRRPSKNVLEICKYLGIEHSMHDRANPRLERAVCKLWDGTQRHEDSLLRLMDALSRVGF
ncbi:helix-turn-helix domain-containing protein [Prosthecobacter debontii]|uniref:helix-turn-helix domain-containing protein n=1 Tax=Prosthecobacter debontii TaxID=48467 RepID=UPI00099AB99E